MTTHTQHRLPVLTEGGVDEWLLTVAHDDEDWRLILHGPEQSWSGPPGPDLFTALRMLRRKLEEASILLGCNGARPNAWSTGLSPGDEHVNLLQLDVHDVSPKVPTLDIAPLDAVASVAEQDSFMRAWFDAHRHCGEPPGTSK